MEVPGKKAKAANRIESVINAWCEPCAGDNDERQPAAGFCATCKEYMCETCLLCHKKSKSGKTHSILSSQDMPSSSVSPTVRGDEHVEEEITELCPIHEKEVIKYICLDHNQLCCADCMLYTHKLCEQLRKISDVCADQSTVNEIYSVQERLDSLSTRVDDEIEKSAKQNPVNEEQYQSQLQDIGKFTEEITNTLERLKTDFQTQAFNKKEKNKNKMTLIASECKKLKQEVELMKMELQNSSNLSKQFILIKKAENEIHRWEDREKTIEARNHIELVVFDPDCLIKKLFSDVTSLVAFKEEADLLEEKMTSPESDVLLKFYRDDLKPLSDYANIVRDNSDFTNDLTIKFKRKNTDKVKKALDSLKQKVYQDSEIYPVAVRQIDSVRKFVQDNKSKPDVLYVLDELKGRVTIFVKKFSKKESALHELRVHLAEIKSTSRAGRSLQGVGSEQQKPSYVAVVNSGGSQGRKDYSHSSDGRYGKQSSPYRRSRDFSSSFSSSTSSRDRFNFSGEFENGLKLKVYEASITRLNVDVIVNAANDCLMHGGGVAKVIADAAGYEFEQESRMYIASHGNLRVSENCITKAGRLQYIGVIHAVGPHWIDYRDKVKCMDALYDCIWNILEACDKNGYITVGMSAISAGIYGVPKELCADMYVKAAAEYSKMLKNEKRFPTELHIIDIDPTILHMVKDSFENWEKDPSSIDQTKTVPLYVNIHGGASNSFQRGKRNEGSSRVNRKFDAV